MARKKEKRSQVPQGTKRLDEIILNTRIVDKPNSSTEIGRLKVELLLSDKRAIKIVESTPVFSRNQVLEKYIILGEMVTSHASISTNKETAEEFFSPLKTDIDLIREQLRIIIPTVAAPAKKMTVDAIFESLKEHFIDDSFEDVSTIGKFADILATTSESKTPILIELKDYNGTVPSPEVEKFWRDIERRNTKYGLFISMRSGISKCSGCITVKTEMNKTAIFINNSELNWAGHIFAFYVIKKISEIETAKRKELSGEQISQIISKINTHAVELQRTVESIGKIEFIADGLRTTCKKKLDELISVSEVLRKNLHQGIDDILLDLEKTET